MKQIGGIMKEYKLLINGKWQESKKVRLIKFPYDHSSVGKVHFAQEDQIKLALAAAEKAFSSAKKLSSYERSKVLENISAKIEEKKEELAQSIVLTSGKPIKSSRVEVARAINTFQIASEEAKRIGGEIIPLDWSDQTKGRWGVLRRFPLGVITAITPFNFPLNLVAHKLGPALASGNTVVLRPASQVSITSLLLGEIINDSGYPDGGLNIVPCGYKEADALLTDKRVKMLTFTGSPAVGWEFKKKANKKKVTLELGGNAAVIIEPDSNLDYALDRVVLGSFAYSGQVCISIQRIFLHEKIYDRFMADFIAKIKKLKMGNPLQGKIDIGPMINVEAAKKTEEWVNEALEKGARLAWGGKREGAMYEPTVLEKVKPELRIAWLEAFAPVVVVYQYKNFEDALQGVNYSIYGLQAGVFTSNLNKAFQAFESLDVGGIIINDVPTFRIDHMPYGGIKESGFGREGLKYAIEEMTEPKLMALNLLI